VTGDNFVMETTSSVTIPTSGYWSFGVSCNDGFKLTLTDGTDNYTFYSDGTRTNPGDRIQPFNILTPGSYRMRLMYFQNTGDAEMELFAAQGYYTSWNSAMKLVGDTASGGLASHRIIALASLAEAEAIISDPAKRAWARTVTSDKINYLNVGRRDRALHRSIAFPGMTTGTASATSLAMQSFVMETTSTISIPTTGRLDLCRQQRRRLPPDAHGRRHDGSGFLLQRAAHPGRYLQDRQHHQGRLYSLRLVYYQSTTAGAELELYATKGTYSSWAGRNDLAAGGQRKPDSQHRPVEQSQRALAGLGDRGEQPRRRGEHHHPALDGDDQPGGGRGTPRKPSPASLVPSRPRRSPRPPRFHHRGYRRDQRCRAARV